MSGYKQVTAALVGSLAEVLVKPGYFALSVFLASAVLGFAIWLPNLKLISTTMFNSGISVVDKVNLLVSFLGAIKTNFSWLSRLLTITTSILFGLNISLLVYYFKQRFYLEKSARMSFGGMISGLLGVGCASCGSVILASFFGVSATASVVGVLPLRGQEFTLLGITILSFSIVALSQKIQNPLVCKPINS